MTTLFIDVTSHHRVSGPLGTRFASCLSCKSTAFIVTNMSYTSTFFARYRGLRQFAILNEKRHFRQRAYVMKPVILKFVGGYWGGKTLRTDSLDQEEQFLAAGCYEMSHHGAIGGECVGLSDDAMTFARSHGWEKAKEAGLRGDHRYLVTEFRETETEIVVTFKYDPIRSS